MKLKKLFQKKNTTNTGIKNINKIKDKENIFYAHTTKNKEFTESNLMSDLDFLLTSLEHEGKNITIEDEDLFKESILESRKNRYHEHCKILNIPEDKNPDSFYQPYSEWPVSGGKWTIIRFDGSENFTIRRKDKDSILELVDDLNNGRPYPYKIIKADYSTKYGVGMEIK